MESAQQLQALARNWLKSNQKLLRKFRGEWIAYNGEAGIIAHDKEASKVMKTAEGLDAWYVLKFLNPYTYGGLRRLLPVHVRPQKFIEKATI